MAVSTRSDDDVARPAHASDRSEWSGRLLPRSMLGMSVLLLSAALGAAFSGAVLYAYYEYRLNEVTSPLREQVEDFQEQVDAGVAIIEEEQEEAQQAVRDELEPIQQLLASEETLDQVLESTSPSVWFVVTRDPDGAPSVGSAFVVFSDADRTFLLTSWHTVRAATREPAPEVRVRKGGEEVPVTLWTWQEELDLALLILDRADQPRLDWAGTDAVRTGERVFAVSGLGTRGGAIIQGFVADVSSSGIQHSAPVGAAFQGGPLVNSKGEVVGVSSRRYAPLNFDPGEVRFAVPVERACDRMLRCPDGAAGGAGERR